MALVHTHRRAHYADLLSPIVPALRDNWLAEVNYLIQHVTGEQHAHSRIVRNLDFQFE